MVGLELGITGMQTVGQKNELPEPSFVKAC